MDKAVSYMIAFEHDLFDACCCKPHSPFLTYSTGPTYLCLPTTRKNTIEKMTIAPNTNIFQFIAPSSGFGLCGKKVITNARTKKHTEKTFSGKPNLPSEKRRGSNGSLRSRLSVTQEMETM